MDKHSELSILVVGSGGREHALVQMCLKSPLSKRVIACPGNGGIAQEVQCFDTPVTEIEALVALAQAEAVDLVIVGPEVPLSLGLVDALEQANILAYGPCQAGAQLEASKAFCKDFFARHNIPTAAYAKFTEVAPALEYLESHLAPIVIKASGLAAGKGVIMAQTQAEAVAAVKDILEGQAFGPSGHEIVIEEMLYGEEVSIHAIVSGDHYACLPASQDHKRVGEGDTGLNTGGMGAYAPTYRVTAALQAEIEASVIRPTIAGLKADGIDFRGTLYAGLMLTEKGIKVLEYNVRFGDPETQVLLPLVKEDLLPWLFAAAEGAELPKAGLKTHPGAAMVVVLAAGGYPGAYPKGTPITLPPTVPENSAIIHAGTELDDSQTLVNNGGRILGVSAQAKDLQSAANLAYTVCDQINYSGKYFRRDIGHRELNRQPPAESDYTRPL